MTHTFNTEIYGNLLLEIAPKVIETELEYERALAIVEQLTFNRNRTPEETALHRLLVILVEAYETEHYPIPEPSPSEILQYIMESSGTCQADLARILGSSEIASSILNRKQSITKIQAHLLAEWFKVSPSLFIKAECS